MNSRSAHLLPPFTTHGGWFLRHYIIKANSEEIVDSAVLTQQICKFTEEIEAHHFSGEYEYFRYGFVISHFGNRGVCFTIWHWGRWGSTLELYQQSWYTYGRDLGKLSLLESADPVSCFFELPTICNELALFQSLVSQADGIPTVTAFASTK